MKVYKVFSNQEIISVSTDKNFAIEKFYQCISYHRIHNHNGIVVSLEKSGRQIPVRIEIV
jgi:hypothetical protein